MEQDKIRKNLQQYIMNIANTNDINCDCDLFMEGVLDSLHVAKLVIYIEEQYDIFVKEDEVVPENFSTINKITNYIKQKSTR